MDPRLLKLNLNSGAIPGDARRCVQYHMMESTGVV